MRRLWCALLCFTLFFLTGCTYAQSQAQVAENTYALYFTRQDLSQAAGEDAIQKENFVLPESGELEEQELAQTLLTHLLSGPQSELLTTPIPAGTQLLSVTLDGTRAQVDVSSQYRTLSGVSLTMADYCIAMTLCQLPFVETVSVTVRGQELDYRDTQIFSAESVLLSSTEDIVGTVEVSLYFRAGDGSLAPEKRTLELYEGDTQAQSLLTALIAGPESKELSPVLPEDFVVFSAWIEEDMCYVNLPSEHLQKFADTAALRVALDAMTQSLCSLDSVEEVQYLVDGNLTGSYDGVALGAPFVAVAGAGN